MLLRLRPLAALMLMAMLCSAHAGAVAQPQAGASEARPKENAPPDNASQFQQRLVAKMGAYTSAAIGPHPGSVPPAQNLSWMMTKLSLALAVVIGLGLGCAWFWKSFAVNTLKLRPSGLRVLSRIQMTTKSSVYILEAIDRILVVGEHPTGLTCLTEITDPVEVDKARIRLGAEKPLADTPFEAALQQAQSKLFPPTPLEKTCQYLSGWGQRLWPGADTGGKP